MKKKRLFLLVLVAGLLLTCTNHYITELLKAPSELTALNVKVYAGSTLLEGVVAFEPGFAQAVRDYLVYIPDETTHFVIEPEFKGKGTVLCLNYHRDENTGPEDLSFRITPDEKELELILTVERENLAPSEYRLNVMRAGGVPVPKGIVVSVNPSIGSFFLERGVVPELSVRANAPEGGGVFSYQWYRNYDNNNRSGTRIEGATGTSYRLSEAETSRAETVYYYVVITNTVDGKTGSMESMTRPVTFIDKEDSLNEKSRDMVRIEGGTDEWDSEIADFYMGKYPVTWELWKLVFDCAEDGGYHFSNIGNQGSDPNGNKLHPVTMVSWNDCVVWCNAYSEMEGLVPVYYDARGNVLRDTRKSPDTLVDEYRMVGKNGYRLPNKTEFGWALEGGEGGYFTGGNSTREVGLSAPNDKGLCDLVGQVAQWGWDRLYLFSGSSLFEYRSVFSSSFLRGPEFWFTEGGFAYEYNKTYFYYTSAQCLGLRVVRDLD
jgi:hypothetical protein